MFMYDVLYLIGTLFQCVNTKAATLPDDKNRNLLCKTKTGVQHLYITLILCSVTPSNNLFMQLVKQSCWLQFSELWSRDVEFNANLGWFHCFKSWADLHNMKVSSEAASVNLFMSSTVKDFNFMNKINF